MCLHFCIYRDNHIVLIIIFNVFLYLLICFLLLRYKTVKLTFYKFVVHKKNIFCVLMYLFYSNYFVPGFFLYYVFTKACLGTRWRNYIQDKRDCRERWRNYQLPHYSSSKYKKTFFTANKRELSKGYAGNTQSQ